MDHQEHPSSGISTTRANPVVRRHGGFFVFTARFDFDEARTWFRVTLFAALPEGWRFVQTSIGQGDEATRAEGRRKWRQLLYEGSKVPPSIMEQANRLARNPTAPKEKVTELQTLLTNSIPEQGISSRGNEP
jgi:hypothetical protein